MGYLHVDAGSLKLLGFEHVRTVDAVSEVEPRVTVSDDAHVWQMIAFGLPYSPEIPRIDPTINNSSHVWRSLMVLRGEKLHTLQEKFNNDPTTRLY